MRFLSTFALTSNDWMPILRLTPVVLGSILLFSVIDFSLAVTYARQLYNAPLDESKMDHSKAKRWSTAWFVFYSGFFPLLSLAQAFIDGVIFFFARLEPICTLTASVLLLVGWAVQILFWCHCDYAPDSNRCYQFYILGNTYSDTSSSLIGVSDSITAAKLAFGLVVLILYLVYLAMAATAVKLMKKSDHVRVDEDEEPEVESQGQTERNNRSNADLAQFLLP